MEKQVQYSQFESIEMRVGTILEATVFAEARKPAYKLIIDFGPEIGVKKSSAQITDHYNAEDLPGKQVVAVVNFPPRQIGPFMSECLVLGAVDAGGKVVLLTSDQRVGNGLRIL
jgi:tRNA-binding protein